MKKTFNINLAGYPFTIDDDAYQLLKDYLDTIRYAFDTKDDTGEIAADIESRIAELLIENESGRVRIVTFDEISKVIERIGKPSEFIEVESTRENHKGPVTEEEIHIDEETLTPPPYVPNQKGWKKYFRGKQLYRDPRNSMLGGVCSGIAAYFNVDVTIVRLLTVLLFFLSGSSVAIIYIVLWIVVPEARTPLQRMRMKGDDTTMENIGKTVKMQFCDEEEMDNGEPQSAFSKFLSNAFSIFVKVLIILGLIVTVPLLIVLGAGLIGCVVAVFVIGLVILGGISAGPYGMFDSTQECQMVFYILLAVIGGILTLGIPLWLLFRKLLKKDEKGYNSSNRNALLIAWLCGIAVLSVFTVKAVKKGEQLDMADRQHRLERLNDIGVDKDEIEKINIEENGVTVTDKNGKKVIINRGGVRVEVEENITTETKENPVDSIEGHSVVVEE